MRDFQTDAEAIARSLADGQAFVFVFQRHFDAISRYLRRRVNPETAEELTGEVFAAAFSARRRYDLSRPDARPWLYGIASNLLKTQTRIEARELDAFVRTGVDPVNGSNEPRASVEGWEQMAVAEALSNLASIDRDVLLLFAWAELSYEEIAEALDLRVGTVRSRLNRARGQMRAALATDLAFIGEGGHRKWMS